MNKKTLQARIDTTYEFGGALYELFVNGDLLLSDVAYEFDARPMLNLADGGEESVERLYHLVMRTWVRLEDMRDAAVDRAVRVIAEAESFEYLGDAASLVERRGRVTAMRCA